MWFTKRLADHSIKFRSPFSSHNLCVSELFINTIYLYTWGICGNHKARNQANHLLSLIGVIVCVVPTGN